MRLGRWLRCEAASGARGCHQGAAGAAVAAAGQHSTMGPASAAAGGWAKACHMPMALARCCATSCTPAAVSESTPLSTQSEMLACAGTLSFISIRRGERSRCSSEVAKMEPLWPSKCAARGFSNGTQSRPIWKALVHRAPTGKMGRSVVILFCIYPRGPAAPLGSGLRARETPGPSVQPGVQWCTASEAQASESPVVGSSLAPLQSPGSERPLRSDYGSWASGRPSDSGSHPCDFSSWRGASTSGCPLRNNTEHRPPVSAAAARRGPCVSGLTV